MFILVFDIHAGDNEMWHLPANFTQGICVIYIYFTLFFSYSVFKCVCLQTKRYI